MQAVEKQDPARRILSIVGSSDSCRFLCREPSLREQDHLQFFMHQAFHGKSLLNMSGGSDKLVPYRCSNPFLRWVEKTLRPGGPFPDIHFTLEDIVFEGVGHAMNSDMAKALDRFVVDTLSRSKQPDVGKISKM